MTVDLRSDTLSQPTAGMLEAMSKARVGDDVFGEDPTVNLLEQQAAELFGMEAAIYCTSGTQSNQIAIKAHTQPGEEVVCEKTSHIYLYEAGGIAFHSGCQVKLLEGDRGRIRAEQIAEAINPDDVHKPVTRLLSLENTANRGGGSCYTTQELEAIRQTCDQHQLILHLDGARLFNALIATKESPKNIGRLFHSISICLNKGLGCPMGSLLIGTKPFIRQARRIRKLMGGGLRQVGYMAATGVYALEHHVQRLEEDHRRARAIAEVIAMQSYCGKLYPVETNIILFETALPNQASTLIRKLDEKGIKAIALSPQLVRMVLYLNITPEMVATTIKAVQSIN